MSAINTLNFTNYQPANAVFPRQLSQPAFGNRLIPTKISYKYENIVFKSILSPIMTWKARKFSGIKRVLKPILHEVKLPARKGELYAWEANPENSKKYVLFLHGMKGKNPAPPNQTLIEEIIKKGGYGVITPEYRGTAKLSKYPFTFNNMTEDSQATLDYLHRKGIKSEDITIIAHCIGSIPTATIASHEQGIGKILLISPISNGNDYGNSLLRRLNLNVPNFVREGMNRLISLFMPYDMNINKIIKDVESPITIIMPELDKLISVKQAKALSQDIKNLQEFITIPNEQHSLTKKISQIITEHL